MPPQILLAALLTAAALSGCSAVDRVLLQVWTSSGANVSRTLLAEGYATVLVVRPNVTHLVELRAAEAKAREQGAGLWGACR